MAGQTMRELIREIHRDTPMLYLALENAKLRHEQRKVADKDNEVKK
jgi:hypothetical protein